MCAAPRKCPPWPIFAVMTATVVPRVTSAAPKLGLALGYDVEAELERRDEGDQCAVRGMG